VVVGIIDAAVGVSIVGVAVVVDVGVSGNSVVAIGVGVVRIGVGVVCIGVDVVCIGVDVVCIGVGGVGIVGRKAGVDR